MLKGREEEITEILLKYLCKNDIHDFEGLVRDLCLREVTVNDKSYKPNFKSSSTPINIDDLQKLLKFYDVTSAYSYSDIEGNILCATQNFKLYITIDSKSTYKFFNVENIVNTKFKLKGCVDVCSVCGIDLENYYLAKIL